MSLSSRERELVALGAAMGANCVPCIEHHIAESRKIGLADADIAAAIRYADRVRQVPARQVLEAAVRLVPAAGAADDASPGPGGGPEPASAPMAGMMAAMMRACGSAQGPSGAAQAVDKDAAGAAPNAGRGCC